MSAILLSAHVVVAILAVGPIAVAASMFPRYARECGPVANALYRICQTYAVVGVAILPDQRAVLAVRAVTRLAMTTGIFNVLWVAVTVLMIVRPGSTTGV